MTVGRTHYHYSALLKLKFPDDLATLSHFRFEAGETP